MFSIHLKLNISDNGQKKYRDMLDIIKSILGKTGDGCKKTHIMYGANLSPVQLNRYLDMLIKIGCIAYDNENRLYQVTLKGQDLLQAISSVTRAKADLIRSQQRVNTFIAVE